MHNRQVHAMPQRPVDERAGRLLVPQEVLPTVSALDEESLDVGAGKCYYPRQQDRKQPGRPITSVVLPLSDSKDQGATLLEDHRELIGRVRW